MADSNHKNSTPNQTLELVQEEEDRISDLPDSLLLQILSHLWVDDVIRTGTLSKRWQHLWTFVPNLLFPSSIRNFSDNMFVSVVNRTLIQSRVSKIFKLTIFLKYNASFVSDVDSWLSFATRNNVEDLDLVLLVKQNSQRYILPQNLYTCSSFKFLILCSCNVSPKVLISWTSLKTLFFVVADLSDEVIESILLGCPVLENLKLSSYRGFNRLKIYSASLRQLDLDESLKPVFVHDDDDDDDDGLLEISDDGLLEISAPRLCSLKISGDFYTSNIHSEDISSLVVADLTFYPHDETITNFDHGMYRNVFQKLIEKLHHVTELKFGSWCIQVLSIFELRGLPSPLLNCKCLQLYIHIAKWDLPGIAKLLQISPSLETLVINTETHYPRKLYFGGDFLDAYNFDGENYFASQKWMLLHLKNVKIYVVRKMLFEFELVKFLLKNAPVLEKMVIYSICDEMCCTSQEILPEAQDLLSFPRSSPHAEVIISKLSSVEFALTFR